MNSSSLTKKIRLACCFILGLIASTVIANESTSSQELRRFYYPGTEELGKDEMRVIALGTGRPLVQRGQASACWLVQLGNGENFLFDIGTGCAPNLSLLDTSWNEFDKLFLSHLHSDHFGDFGAMYVAGILAGRTKPVRIWGPSGTEPELGARAAIEHIEKAYLWDKRSRQGQIPVTGMATEITEFDYSKTQVVYDHNGVTIRSWPAIHGIDGPVSFDLNWNGLKFVYSGDTVPNKWFMENAADADILVHECFNSVNVLMQKYSALSAWMVGTQIHTSPQAAGRIFSMLKPRMAVCYHFINDPLTLPDQLDSVRMTYDGPLSMAQDMMVWNVTGNEINQRITVAGESTLAIGERKDRPDTSLLIPKSQWLDEGKLELPGVNEQVFDGLAPEAQRELREKVPASLLPE
jgi:ribonuclease Z